mgnify:FL=1|jgi:hypothetical protein
MDIIEAFTGSIIQKNNIDMTTSAIMMLIHVGILLLLGKYLWNNVIVEIMPYINKINNIWQILGLIIFVIIVKRV